MDGVFDAELVVPNETTTGAGALSEVGVRDNAAMCEDHHARQYPLYLYEFRYRDPRTGK